MAASRSSRFRAGVGKKLADFVASKLAKKLEREWRASDDLTDDGIRDRSGDGARAQSAEHSGLKCRKRYSYAPTRRSNSLLFAAIAHSRYWH